MSFNERTASWTTRTSPGCFSPALTDQLPVVFIAGPNKIDDGGKQERRVWAKDPDVVVCEVK